MRFNDDNRRPKPGRGSETNRDGKNFSKKRSYGNHRGSDDRDFDKPRFGGDNRDNGADYRGGNRDDAYGNRPFKPRFDKGGSGSYNSNRGGAYKKSNDYGDDFKPRLVKKSDLNTQDRDGKKPFERYAKSQTLKSYTETRFNEGSRKMRPRKSTSADYDENAKYSRKKQIEYSQSNVDYTKPMRLNKFIANAGLCSRREADEYIKAGVVTVNGQVVCELGSKVIPATDRVLFHDQLVQCEKKVYLLLNKPKDCVTTTEDTNARLTVMDLVKNACNERIYPVGRLDRNTTGVLLLTNDGDLAARLMHPKYSKKKIYHAHLDRPLTHADMQQISDGIELEDGPIHADEINYVEDDKKQIGIEIHSGRNRLVRRIFEHLGYKVIRLDRVFFAGLTKKNLSRGQWRFLSEKEVNILRMGAYE